MIYMQIALLQCNNLVRAHGVGQKKQGGEALELQPSGRAGVKCFRQRLADGA
jgi:hypothetical protein